LRAALQRLAGDQSDLAAVLAYFAGAKRPVGARYLAGKLLQGDA
jgi:hypothetical protein